MPPKTRTNEEMIREAAKEAARIALEEASSGTGTTKVSQILKQANTGTISHQPESVEEIEKVKLKERQELEKAKEKLEKDLEESEVYCPTCSAHKHEHKLKKTENGRMKCTGDGCNTEYALIPTSAEYVCKDCGLPHKKPEEEVPDDKCPFCNSNEFERPKVSLEKIRERVQKKKK